MLSIDTCDVDLIAVMSDTVNDCICKRTVITAKLVVPLLKAVACALGNAACRKFYTVKYIRMPELLDELK